MIDPKNILVAVDDFGQSQPLINYVADLVGDDNRFQVHLFHAAGPLPPKLLESSGAENPTEEIRVEQKQERAQLDWASKVRAETEQLFEFQKSQLAAARVPQDHIFSHFLMLNQQGDLVRETIKAAHQSRCGTIVVGYESYGWIREQFRTHVSEALIAESSDVAICVVGK